MLSWCFSILCFCDVGQYSTTGASPSWMNWVIFIFSSFQRRERKNERKKLKLITPKNEFFLSNNTLIFLPLCCVAIFSVFSVFYLPTTNNVVVQATVSLDIGCRAVYVMFNMPRPSVIFSTLLIHDGLIVTSRLKFTSVFGFCNFTWTLSLFCGNSTSWFDGQINFGVGNSVGCKKRDMNCEIGKTKKPFLLTYTNAIIQTVPFAIVAACLEKRPRCSIATSDNSFCFN